MSIIVPLLNEECNIHVVTRTIIDEADKLNLNYELILVDDGSSDNTWLKIREAARAHASVKGISLSKNFGPQNAIFAGFYHSSGSAVITMDGDMQHPPEKIADMYAAWKDGYKVVETKRIDSEDVTLLKRASSSLFNRIFSYLSDLSMAKGTSDFRLLDRSVVDVIKEMRDSELFLRGITHWVGFKRTTISYMANKRLSGKTKLNLIKLFRYSLGAILSFH